MRGRRGQGYQHRQLDCPSQRALVILTHAICRPPRLVVRCSTPACSPPEPPPSLCDLAAARFFFKLRLTRRGIAPVWSSMAAPFATEVRAAPVPGARKHHVSSALDLIPVGTLVAHCARTPGMLGPASSPAASPVGETIPQAGCTRRPEQLPSEAVTCRADALPKSWIRPHYAERGSALLRRRERPEPHPHRAKVRTPGDGSVRCRRRMQGGHRRAPRRSWATAPRPRGRGSHGRFRDGGKRGARKSRLAARPAPHL